ncbi:MAG: cupin domain-containing protein [Deltaproteobacteria bacterium]|nr:cupin domain-containing protein [Deltaproteobacteria bacterium]
MQQANISAKKELFKDDAVNKVTYLKTEQLVQDTYYFKPNQVLDYHRHPQGDQVFFVHEGEGTYYTDDGKEESTALKPGVTVLAPKGVWHKVVAKTNLVVSQATAQPAGMEKR